MVEWNQTEYSVAATGDFIGSSLVVHPASCTLKDSSTSVMVFVVLGLKTFNVIPEPFLSRKIGVCIS